MLKRTLTKSDYFLIAVNILPVIGVWVLDWKPTSVFLVYCFETIIIGFFNLVKMGIVTVVRKTDTWYSQGIATKQSGIFFMFFFLMHYGIFVGVQMGLFFGVSGIGDEYNIDIFNFFYKWPQLISIDALYMLSTFVLFYGYRTVAEFILSGQYRTIPLALLMFQPYARIFIQQFVVILGSMFLVFGAGKIFILIFAAVKIFFEMYINLDGILNKSIREMKEG